MTEQEHRKVDRVFGKILEYCLEAGERFVEESKEPIDTN
jgi:hypothetical protein